MMEQDVCQTSEEEGGGGVTDAEDLEDEEADSSLHHAPSFASACIPPLYEGSEVMRLSSKDVNV